MSNETIEWLNTNTRIGFTDNRGHAWHWREGATNHFSGPVPREEVVKLLNQVKPVKRRTGWFNTETGQWVEMPDTTTIVDGTTHFGTFKSTYQIHPFEEWLVHNVDTLLNEDVGIGSAGLLAKGATAWVQVEMPESVRTPDGVDLRPNLLAVTSLNGRYATGYQECYGIVVCDNTLAGAYREKGRKVRIRHTRLSLDRIGQVRADLAIMALTDMAEEITGQIGQLVQVKVNDATFTKWLNAWHPVPEETGRAKTRAQNIQDDMYQLWEHDARVTPWKKTAFGVLQAANTYETHFKTVKGTNRAERNMMNVLDGKTDKADNRAFEVLESVLGRELLKKEKVN